MVGLLITMQSLIKDFTLILNYYFSYDRLEIIKNNNKVKHSKILI